MTIEKTSTKYEKPIPLKTPDNQPYWDAADNHELAIQCCGDCQQVIHPPGPACPHCGSPTLEWIHYGSDITGEIYSFVMTYVPMLPGFQHDLPTIIAQVAVDQVEGIQITANIINAKPEDIAIGKAVKMTWIDVTEDRALPQWELIG
ncbi:Zn-ribbon domain-containing OB-fold protein [Lysinibacillus sp. LZ02]|uniref:Zn-ribbon domain-containing OB-fold protein n=1 Tax=Lysinibacillus sp. LZ02 TaxID=3420668 RepID=UPI003D35BFF9